MSYQMIHMEVAYRLLGRLTGIENAAEFILGSVAPDSVHMASDYDINQKITSHLFEGCGEWSKTQDYGRWLKNIHQFYDVFSAKDANSELPDSFLNGQCLNSNLDRQRQNRDETGFRDFALGICVHCLTDYCNDVKIWNIFREKYIPPMKPEEFREAFYQEARGIDRWLYQNSRHTGPIREMLSKARAFDIGGFVRKENIEQQRNHLLKVQYAVDTVEISGYHFLTAEVLRDFIDSSVNDIAEIAGAW